MEKYYYKMKVVGSDGKITITKDDLMLDEVAIEDGYVKSSKKLTRVGDEKISLYDSIKSAKESGKSFGVQRCNNPKCTVCFDLCPADAITFIKDDVGRIIPDVDYNKCIKCGRCIDNCPMGVFLKA